MQFSFPFDSDIEKEQPDRVFNSQDDRLRHGSLVGNGVYAEPSNNLQVIWIDGMNVVVKEGKAWNSGAFFYSNSDTKFTLQPANALNDRIDTIILRFDLLNRKIELKLITGVPSNSPTPSAKVRNNEIYDLKLAEITVKKAVASISQSAIRDTRLIKSECGQVAGLIPQMDATTIYNQYESLFKEKSEKYTNDVNTWFGESRAEFEKNKTAYNKEFNDWFNAVKGQISEDMATKIAGDIVELKKNKQDKTVSTDKKTPEDILQSYPIGTSFFTTIDLRWNSKLGIPNGDFILQIATNNDGTGVGTQEIIVYEYKTQKKIYVFKRVWYWLAQKWSEFSSVPIGLEINGITKIEVVNGILRIHY